MMKNLLANTDCTKSNYKYLNGRDRKNFFLLVVCVFVFLCLIVYTTSYNKLDIKYQNEFMINFPKCTNLIPELIETDVPENSIFFIETSHVYETIINVAKLGTRQACSVESSARHNPNRTVFVLFFYPTKFPEMFSPVDHNTRVLFELYKYENIKIRSVNVLDYSKNTPLEKWFQTDKLKRSSYLPVHASDVLRYLTLWKFGGTYLDTDLMLLKKLDTLPSNFACFQEKNYVNNGVLSLDRKNVGKSVAEMFLKEISESFNGQLWGQNGPDLVTGVSERKCAKIPLGSNLQNLECKGFHILPSEYFYKIPYGAWNQFFSPGTDASISKDFKNSYGIHLWNKLSHNKKVGKHEKDVVYNILAQNHCPNVYRESSDIF